LLPYNIAFNALYQFWALCFEFLKNHTSYVQETEQEAMCKMFITRDELLATFYEVEASARPWAPAFLW